jgi:hypothetical protein
MNIELTDKQTAALNTIVSKFIMDGAGDYKRMEALVEKSCGFVPDYDTTWYLCNRSEKMRKQRASPKKTVKVSFQLS